MTIVIQNCKSHLYLHRNGEWTEDAAAAANFGSSVAARSYIQAHGLAAAQIVMCFGDPKYDVVLPISEECRDKAA